MNNARNPERSIAPPLHRRAVLRGHPSSGSLHGLPLQLLAIIVTITLLRLILIQIQFWPVNGDETQYWNWSKHLAWGYYSKPPMIAWLISYSTAVFGDGIFGLRFFAPICHALTAIVLYFIGRDLYNPKIGLWTAVTYVLLPGVSFSSSIISTDVPLLLFWALAFYALIHALKDNKLMSWCYCGIALGCALLSKYAAVFFIISLVLCLHLPAYRHLRKSLGPYVCLGIAFLIIMPNLMWNYDNNFATFHATSANANMSKSGLHPLQTLVFLLSQGAILGPIIALAFLWMICWHWRDLLKANRQMILLSFLMPILIIMIIESFLSRAHANWGAPMYITGVTSVVAYFIQTDRMKWLKYALILNVVVILGLICIQPVIRIFNIYLPPQMSITNWSQTGNKIAALRNERYPNVPILVNDRMLMAQTMYYGHIPLQQTFKWNSTDGINDHFELVTNMAAMKGQNFLLFTYNKYPTEIFAHFAEVKAVKAIRLKTLDGRGSYLYSYYLINFKGYHD